MKFIRREIIVISDKRITHFEVQTKHIVIFLCFLLFFLYIPISLVIKLSKSNKDLDSINHKYSYLLQDKITLEKMVNKLSNNLAVLNKYINYENNNIFFSEDYYLNNKSKKSSRRIRGKTIAETNNTKVIQARNNFALNKLKITKAIYENQQANKFKKQLLTTSNDSNNKKMKYTGVVFYKDLYKIRYSDFNLSDPVSYYNKKINSISNSYLYTRQLLSRLENIIHSFGFAITRNNKLKKISTPKPITKIAMLKKDRQVSLKEKFKNQGGKFFINNLVINDLNFSNITTKNNYNLTSDINKLIFLKKIISSLPIHNLPVKSYYVTSYYGKRHDPIKKGKWGFHHGIDVVTKKNGYIYATAPGTVSKVLFRRSGYGHQIMIYHNFGIYTKYAHMDKIYVKPGQKVKAGTILGTQGNTGRSTGEHLHYEIIFNKKTINPMDFFQNMKKIKFLL